MIKPPAQWSIDLLAQEAITRMCKTEQNGITLFAARLFVAEQVMLE